MKITVGIPTKDRYPSLSHCLLSIAMQTVLPFEIIVIDDSDAPQDIRELPIFNYILQLLTEKGIKWEVVSGLKKGQAWSHQIIQEKAKGDWIFRVDDDVVCEAKCLEWLTLSIDKIIPNTDKIGAVAPLVLMPSSKFYEGGYNEILNLEKDNVQWLLDGSSVHTVFHKQEHLYSCFLYRKGIVNYNLSLSQVSHREETLFTYEMFRKGYSLHVESRAIVRHFRMESGGIRTQTDHNLWYHDDGIFNTMLSLWNVKYPTGEKIVVLDCGLGDHYAFKHILPAMQDKYGKVKIACCFDGVFWDVKGIELISIADAYNMFTGCIDEFNIYKKMYDWKWNESIVLAFHKLYMQ